MKKTFQYLWMLVAVAVMASCSQEDALETVQQKMTFVVGDYPVFGESSSRADIGTPDKGKTGWADGDKILVSDGTQGTTLAYQEGVWTPESSVSFTGDVAAVYAPGCEISDDAIALKSDRQYGMDEYISAQTTVSGNTVYIRFENTGRNYSRLRIAAAAGDELTVSVTGFTPAGSESEVDGGSYALVADANGNAFLYGIFAANGAVEVKNSTATLAEHAFTAATERGKSYALKVIPNFDATEMTAEQLNAAVTKALEYGHTELTVTLAEDAGEAEEYETSEMFVALRTAFAESTVPDGSIDLTISGAKTIPESGFFDYDDYYENDNKNIAGDKLKSLTLTDVEAIGEYAFSACTYLESVNLPKVVTIGDYAFSEYQKGTKLTSLDLPNATTIGVWAFAYSSLLTSVDLPKVVTIGENAFCRCDLRTLDLPEVTTIGSDTFGANYNLVSCSAPKATTIGYYPWGNCSKLETLELTAAGEFTLYNNLFANTPTGQINLVLNEDKASQVTQNDDGTATWKTTNRHGGKLEYTFKSITMLE